jgi:hypothetical protein
VAHLAITGSSIAARNYMILFEAAIGIEPMNKGFAQLNTDFI